MRLRFCAAVLVCAFSAAACHGIVSPSNNQTETFPGEKVLVRGNSRLITFTMASLGEYTITVTEMTPSPPSGIFNVSLYYGSDCSQVISSNYATVGSAAASGANPYKGQYCVLVSDAGYFVQTETFTLKVSHP
jgi:hypothetical protein